jgi:hypothetical protein
VRKSQFIPLWEQKSDKEKIRVLDYFSDLADLLNTPDSEFEENGRKCNAIHNQRSGRRIQPENVDSFKDENKLSVLRR